MRSHENGMPRMLSPGEAADIAGELNEEDFEARLEGVRVKWVADEAETLTEASLMLRDTPSGSWSWSWTAGSLWTPSTGVTA